MNRLVLIGAAALSLGLVTAANAQMTTSTDSQTMPNGNTRTNSQVMTPDGSSATKTVDRPDGTRTTVRSRTDVNGNTRSVRHDAGSDMVRVCHSSMQDGHSVRTCHTRMRHHAM